jgi:hypothetical protein
MNLFRKNKEFNIFKIGIENNKSFSNRIIFPITFENTCVSQDDAYIETNIGEEKFDPSKKNIEINGLIFQQYKEGYIQTLLNKSKK